MADERIVNDVRVYQDSAGFYREAPVGDGDNASNIAPAISSTYSMASAADGSNATVISPTPCAVVSVDAYNARTGGVQIAFYDRASVPGPSDKPKWSVYLPPLASTGRDYPTGIRFTTGLTIVLIADDAPGLMAGDVQSLNIGYSA